jgi:lysophospholipase L1-like esterase
MTNETPPGGAELRLLQLEKLYDNLPGLTEALPAIFGLSPEEYASVREGFDDAARHTAEELLTDPQFAERVARLPFKRGDRILAVGDAITSDLQSWAEILRHALTIARPDDDLTVVNGGLGGYTTAMMLRRLLPMLNPAPDWIICELGGADVTRIAGGKTQLALTESIDNLRELQRIAAERTAAQWVWITPIPIDEELAAINNAAQGRSFRNTDLTALADAVKAFDEPVVDLVEVFGVPADPELQGPDGLHPSLAGQRSIVMALVETIST